MSGMRFTPKGFGGHRRNPDEVKFFAGIMQKTREVTGDIDEARILVVPPPLIQGIGSAGGYRLMVQDRQGAGYQALGAEAGKLIGAAGWHPWRPAPGASVAAASSSASPRTGT